MLKRLKKQIKIMSIGVINLNLIKIKYCKRLKIVCVNMNIGTKHFFANCQLPIANFFQPKNTPLPIDAPHCVAQFFANNFSHLLQKYIPFGPCYHL